MRILVIGGTGPTGIPLVQGLLDRGHAVTILHRGTHERDETPAAVAHLHCDPFDEESLRAGLAGHTFDVTYAMYGRLRMIADAITNHTGRLISVGGVPAYRGWMNAWLHEPNGLPVPIGEDAPTVAVPEEDEKGYRIVRTEQAVFAAHPDATHFRYPYVYGPYQLIPREWIIVRRILDRRSRIVVADDGLTLHHYGYTENIAHALMLALDQPEASAGKIFNVADEEVLSVRQVIEIVASALDHTFEVVSMPYDLAVPARPLLAQPLPTHRVLDLTRLRSDLGYHDLVAPREALARTARWLVANPLHGTTEEMTLTDPFDYAAEDRLVEAWLAARQAMAPVVFDPEPGYGMAYSGPGGQFRVKPGFTV